MITEKGLANLRPPVQKGEQGRNPNGRPKGSRNIKTIIRSVLENYPTPNAEEAIWIKATEQAIKGDKDARRDIASYLHDRPIQRTENENKDVDEFSSEDDLAWLHEAQERAKIQFAERMISETEDVKDEAQSILDAK